MKFSITDELPFSRERVFRTHRDKLVELVPYLPNVESIVVQKRDENGDVVKLVNVWKGSDSEIPSVAKPFIRGDMMKWIDRAKWNRGQWRCDWEIELGFLPDAIEARGSNQMTEKGANTVVTISGEIIIHAHKIPGVPKLLASKVGEAVEKFVVKTIEPNLRKTNEGVRRYLTDHPDA